ncbi:HAD-IIIA family hydrolase [Candidatus Woesearchaeota archaeon]|nr:HAD-IIIA family hydrolase [Candidatus Woesearchaeota archaeon]
MIKAIIFDLDDTLVDFMNFKRKASDLAAKAMVKAGLKMSLHRAKKMLFEMYIQDIEGEEVFQNFLKLQRSYHPRILAAGINAYLSYKYKFNWPFKGVKETLRKLKKKGYKLGLLTDAPKLKAYMRLDLAGLADMFDAVVGIEDTKHRKPSKLPFRKILKVMKVKPSEALMVGDWPERDIKGAKAVGIKTCWVDRGEFEGIKSDFVIESFSKILKRIDP